VAELFIWLKTAYISAMIENEVHFSNRFGLSKTESIKGKLNSDEDIAMPNHYLAFMNLVF
jgi:hypothetical protein